ncbi:sigma-70 family RNA polymerase sigma factor [Kitasatospora sp. NBC_01300]|uniref:sigma-70 family RNA polymerase sigma factor n=1 Tax=Kitasatospora sp. NBC_01300 TaxID=2903574 RepID=UPI00352E85C4|nr:sigma-70 family RNA polymerase sigma factor [Kitasatospora sp. NBC_01300]
MDEKLPPDERAALFEAQRPRLRAVAYRMLGSVSEAEEAVHEAWLRYDRTDASDVQNLPGWLTTVVSRVCLNLLRGRELRREEPPEAEAGEPGPTRIPDPLLRREGVADPGQEVLLGDSVGLALMVVLESLAPAERVAFVLHDLFAVPFAEIAPLIERTAATTRRLADRARRRVQDQAPAPDPDPGRQRAAVDGFFAAARAGDLGALVAVLAPGVVLRSDGGAVRSGHPVVLAGATAVADQPVLWGGLSPFARPALVNGAAGAVAIGEGGRPLSVMAFTVVDGAIAAIEVLTDPERLAALDLSAFRG